MQDINIPTTELFERQVLADVVAHAEYFGPVANIVTAAMFATPALAEAWNILTGMYERREPIDMTTVYAAGVSKEVMLEIIDSRLDAASATDLSAIYHAQALADAYTRRSLYLSAYQIMQTAANPGCDIAELVAMPGKAVEGLGQQSTTATNTAGILSDLADELQREETDAAEGRRSRVTTGFSGLDQLMFGGCAPGDLIILAARPSVGKTAIMLQMAMAAAAQGTPVGIYSLEMTNRQIARRMVYSTGRITPAEVAMRHVDWEAYEAAVKDLERLPIRFADNLYTLDAICADITVAAARGKIKAAYIDYLGLIRCDSRLSRYEQISALTPRLKALAKSAGIPIILLAQLNRALEGENRSPELRDLRDSGSIEQDADVVLMAERQGRQLDPDARAIDIWARKNRQGAAGNVGISIMANETFTHFVEM